MRLKKLIKILQKESDTANPKIEFYYKDKKLKINWVGYYGLIDILSFDLIKDKEEE